MCRRRFACFAYLERIYFRPNFTSMIYKNRTGNMFSRRKFNPRLPSITRSNIFTRLGDFYFRTMAIFHREKVVTREFSKKLHGLINDIFLHKLYWVFHKYWIHLVISVAVSCSTSMRNGLHIIWVKGVIAYREFLKYLSLI